MNEHIAVFLGHSSICSHLILETIIHLCTANLKVYSISGKKCEPSPLLMGEWIWRDLAGVDMVLANLLSEVWTLRKSGFSTMDERIKDFDALILVPYVFLWSRNWKKKHKEWKIWIMPKAFDKKDKFVLNWYYDVNLDLRSKNKNSVIFATSLKEIISFQPRDCRP